MSLFGLLVASAQVGSAFAAPVIMPRAEWGAKPPNQPYRTHEISRITIHHAGVATNRNRPFAEMLRNLQAWSQREDKLEGGRTKPAWPDIPYHYYISWRGEIAEARPLQIVGDTNTEYDPTGHLLICLEGNFEVEEPTASQIVALNRLVVHLAAVHRVPVERIASHKDHSSQTSCPGKNLYPELARLRGRLGLLARCKGG